ncbi:TauD/TfdA family dioxygenase [Actinophytocola sp.]|uniref:TauD/TfdA family dioxygenase n=1 Tax=Actinophytocola sp. TaxID=1872138 RepID=UPI00389A7C16
MTTAIMGPAQIFSLKLTDDEQAGLSTLAGRAVRTAPRLVDHDGWQTEVRAMSCHLPVRLLEAIRRFRHDSGPDGTLTVTGLPIEANTLPPTPNVPDSVEHVATVPAALAMLLGQQLGEVIAYREEKQGALVQNVVPVPSLAKSQSNGGSVELEMHTENAFHPNRPDYVGLLCLRAAHQHRVGTRVAAVRRAHPLLDETDRMVLREPRFTTEAPPSFTSTDCTGPQPVLTGSADDPDICVDFHTTSPLDAGAARALSHLREALEEVECELALETGDIVFLDNRLVVHGRIAFRPRYDGTDRWLHRVFVNLDHRRSRISRNGNGSVLG